MKLNRRFKALSVMTVAAALVVGGWLIFAGSPAQTADMIVYKSPWCGCCGEWIAHMRAEGFTVAVDEREDTDPIKARYGVPGPLQSCHTARVGGYTVEGHVPAVDIRQLLAERPAADGIAVPGMPANAPGMEQGGEKEPYKVILFGDNGYSIFARY